MKNTENRQSRADTARALNPAPKSASAPDLSVVRRTQVEEQMDELNQACERLTKSAVSLEDRLGSITYREPQPVETAACGGIPPDPMIAPHANFLRNIQRAINAEASRLEALHRSIEL